MLAVKIEYKEALHWMIKRLIWHLGSLSGWRQAGKNWSGCDMLYTSTSLKCITFWHQLELQQTVPREKWQTLISVKEFGSSRPPLYRVPTNKWHWFISIQRTRLFAN